MPAFNVGAEEEEEEEDRSPDERDDDWYYEDDRSYPPEYDLIDWDNYLS